MSLLSTVEYTEVTDACDDELWNHLKFYRAKILYKVLTEGAEEERDRVEPHTHVLSVLRATHTRMALISLMGNVADNSQSLPRMT